jgi:hypothetical protein
VSWRHIRKTIRGELRAMKETKENKQMLKDIGLLMRMDKWSSAQAKKTQSYGKKADYIKLGVATGVLLNEAVKIIIPKDTTSNKPYNIVRALKEMKQYIHMKGYDK